MGFISHPEEEWQLVGDRVGVMIMHDFCEGNMLCPGGQVRATEDPKVGFDFLVNVMVLFPYCSLFLIVHSFQLTTWRGNQ